MEWKSDISLTFQLFMTFTTPHQQIFIETILPIFFYQYMGHKLLNIYNFNVHQKKKPGFFCSNLWWAFKYELGNLWSLRAFFIILWETRMFLKVAKSSNQFLTRGKNPVIAAYKGTIKTNLVLTHRIINDRMENIVNRRRIRYNLR